MWLYMLRAQVAITVPGDNSVDIFTNDLGIVVISDEAGEVQGYNLLVGGGMGRTARSAGPLPAHTRSHTVPPPPLPATLRTWHG